MTPVPAMILARIYMVFATVVFVGLMIVDTAFHNWRDIVLNALALGATYLIMRKSIRKEEENEGCSD